MSGHIFRQHNASTILAMQQEAVSFGRFRLEKLGDELMSRLGLTKYDAWLEAAITDKDGLTDIIEKMEAKLDELDSMHKWENDPKHIKTNGVY